jgi:NAD(P)-dependent dehydrogenase (short-subunit alcohol dehydrogenase family)
MGDGMSTTELAASDELTANDMAHHDRPARGVAVVTGGSAGLGRAIVRELAGAGFDVAVLARGADGVKGAVVDVEQTGRRGLGVTVDLVDAAAVSAAAERVEAELGPIDVWVNNAMASVFSEFLEVSPEEFDRATSVTYLGTVNGTRAALTHMTSRDSGHVIQIGSALAFRGIPLQAAYCGAKHAMVGFTESVITELLHKHSQVKVSMVHMPALNTVQFSWVRSKLPHHPQPVPPIYQPEVGARAVRRVVDHPRRSTWVGSPTVGTVLGNRLVPGLLDRYLGRTGFDSQQAKVSPGPMIGDNVFEPVAGDHGAHGVFHAHAHEHSQQVWLAQHKGVIGAGLSGTLALAALALRGRRR